MIDAGSVAQGTPSGNVLPLTVTGLSIGDSATVTVTTTRSGFADGSASVTAAAKETTTILITGTRSGDRLNIVGNTTGIDPGVAIAPHVSLDGGAFEPGANIRDLDADGSFTWQRRVLRGKEAAVYFSDGQTVSNTLTFPVTPTIVITGTRSGERVNVTGVTTNLRPSTQLTPVLSFNGGAERDGANIRPLGSDETFSWQRRVLVSKVLTVYFTDGSTRSNVITLAP
jgi:hypothetical protein